MKKKLLALVTVAAMGIAVAGATPQTTFEKGQAQVNAGYSNIQGEYGNYDTKHKGNIDAGMTYAVNDKTAIQYNYQGLNTKIANGFHTDNRMHELNAVRSLNNNFAVYGGYANIGGDNFNKNKDIAQVGVIAKKQLGNSPVEAYAKGAVGTNDTSLWEAGLGYKATQDLDISAGYKQLNTANGNNSSNTFKGFTAGASYRFK